MRRILALAGTGALLAVLIGTPGASATYRGDNGRIAFVASSSAGRDIFTISPDGTRQRQLTRLGNVRDPRFDATGTRIAFARVGKSKNVWVMRADGSGQEPLIVGPSNQSQPAWSPDGERLAFTSDRSGRRQVHVYTFATGAVTQVTQPGGGLRSAWAPAWSPDGDSIAFVGRIAVLPEGEFERVRWEVILTIGSEGGEPTRITESGFASRPDWTPSGRRLLFAYEIADHRDLCPVHASSIQSDGSQTRPTRLATYGCFEFDPVRSPNGRRMALWSTGRRFFVPDPLKGLYVARADGTEQRLIATDVRSNLGIDWQRRS